MEATNSRRVIYQHVGFLSAYPLISEGIPCHFNILLNGPKWITTFLSKCRLSRFKEIPAQTVMKQTILINKRFELVQRQDCDFVTSGFQSQSKCNVRLHVATNTNRQDTDFHS